MDLTPYIPFGSALLGALVGGSISWLNLNRQFKEQRKRDILQERKNERIALNSVKKEVEYNMIQLLNMKKKMEQYQMEFVDFGPANVTLQTKKDKWLKHSDTIEFIQELNDKIPYELEYFYYFIGVTIDDHKVTLKAINDILPIGNRLMEELDNTLKELESK